MKTIRIYERDDIIRFKRGRKIVRGSIVARWAKGEGDGYGVDGEDGEYYDVRAASIIGLAAGNDDSGRAK